MSKIEKGSIDTDEDEQKYKCLCGVHVRVAALIFSVINILFWAAIIALLTKYHVSNKIPLNQHSWSGFGISSTFLITSAFIILGERFNQPWLFIPFLFIDCIKLCLVGFSLIGLILLLVAPGTVIEGLLDASEITVGYAVLIVACAFIFILDMFWIYSWSVILQACKHMRIRKNENVSLMTGGLSPSKVKSLLMLISLFILLFLYFCFIF